MPKNLKDKVRAVKNRSIKPGVPVRLPDPPKERPKLELTIKKDNGRSWKYQSRVRPEVDIPPPPVIIRHDGDPPNKGVEEYEGYYRKHTSRPRERREVDVPRPPVASQRLGDEWGLWLTLGLLLGTWAVGFALIWWNFP